MLGESETNPMPPERLGLDPRWDEATSDVCGIAVRASAEPVAEALELLEVATPLADVLFQAAPALPGDGWREAVYVYQILDCRWSVVEGMPPYLSRYLAERLSSRLNTEVFCYDYVDTMGAADYTLFDGGEVVEGSQAMVPEIFDGEEGADFLKDQQARGWIIARDFGRSFYTRRGTVVDINDPDACARLPHQVAASLGLYLPHFLWTTDENDLVKPGPGWTLDRFVAAHVLRAKDPYQPQPETAPREFETLRFHQSGRGQQRGMLARIWWVATKAIPMYLRGRNRYDDERPDRS